MAGSYNHIVDEDGRLSSGETINGMLECTSGDVVECVNEMYGMIWYLADVLAHEDRFDPILRDEYRKGFVENARRNYKVGLEASPGVVEGD